METERRWFEVRAAEGDGREISGVALRYGDVAKRRGILERFEPRALQIPDDVALVVQHDRAAIIARTGPAGSLELADNGEAITFRATLPNTPRADQALADVRAGLLRGSSIEFQSQRERMEGRTRVISRAMLDSRIALVDTPSYPGSAVEARAQGDGDPRPLQPFIL